MALDRILVRVHVGKDIVHQARTVLVTDRDGQIRSSDHGLYQHDTRVLSRYRLALLAPGAGGAVGRAGEVALRRVDGSNVDANTWLAYFTNDQVPAAPDDPDRPAIGQAALVIGIGRFVGDGMHEDLDVANHSRGRARFDLALELEADFADLMEVSGGVEPKALGPVRRSFVPTSDGRGGRLRFDYAFDGLSRSLILDVDPGPGAGLVALADDDRRLVLSLDLGPQQRFRTCLAYSTVIDGRPIAPVYRCDAFGGQDSRRDRLRAEFVEKTTHLHTSSHRIDAAFRRAVADLADLRLYDREESAECWVPGAGLPHYVALFGRDTLTAAWQSAMVDPALMRGVIDRLAALQGRYRDDYTDEDPGRIPHEARVGPLAMTGRNPRKVYYGDVVATPFLLVVLSELYHWTGDRAVLVRHRETIDRCLRWIDRYGDFDGDGFVEYQTRSPQGNKQQGWKDSDDAIRDHLGDIVEPPIATCEVQAFVYAAKLRAAEMLAELGDFGRARRVKREADEIAMRFDAAFWMPEAGFYALALDPKKRQVKSITSNPGHCLATGIVPRFRAAQVARRLMQPDLFSGWGVRTLSAEHPAYNPISYHLGTVWPVEQATFLVGLRRYGFDREAMRLAEGLFALAGLFEDHRLPEVVGGTTRDARHPFPAIYPRANAPQAWSASALISAVHTILGVRAFAPARTVVVSPVLPEWLPEATLEGLRVGDARATIRFHRDRRGRSHHQVLAREGILFVVAQKPRHSVTERLSGRIGDLAESALFGHGILHALAPTPARRRIAIAIGSAVGGALLARAALRPRRGRRRLW